MEYRIEETAERIKGLREAVDYTAEYVAQNTDVTVEEYLKYENGEQAVPLPYLNSLAKLYDVNYVQILTGQTPKLSKYGVVRDGKGLPVKRREGFQYQDIAYLFKGKKIVPVQVTAPYEMDAENKPITLSSHAGQELDLVLEGTLKILIDGKTEILEKGDAIYYDSSTPHGMIAIGGYDCKFLAVLV